MKPNTRQFDRMIRNGEALLKRVKNGEISALSGSEQAKVLFHAGRGARRVMRGKSTAPADRAIDRVFAAAEERIGAEIDAARQARTAVIKEAATATVAKKSSGWW
ncbi:hypothetical protein [Streptomyces tricolor]|uniref:hypothetical protein n=1 Tax=Streptomyces tricolor TaxID=68277 RepID=UPI0036EC6C4D